MVEEKEEAVAVEVDLEEDIDLSFLEDDANVTPVEQETVSTVEINDLEENRENRILVECIVRLFQRF